MKNKLKLGTAILLCIFSIGICSLSLVSFSAGNDPLVTLSYLTNVIIPQFKKDVIADVSVMLDERSAEEPEINEADSGNNGTYTLLELEEGQCIYTNSTLEFIVRPGSSVCCVSPFEAQGIADITKGTEYLDGDVIGINTYCLIPRGADERGIKVLNEKSYILVRGEYYIG